MRVSVFCRALLLGIVVSAGVKAAVFQSGAGRFEVSAWDADVAQQVTSSAEEAWRSLASPLGLPDAFSSPVFLRVVRPAEWQERSLFLTQVEPGGVVSVRLVWASEPAQRSTERAIVQGLLMRLAVAQHGVHSGLDRTPLAGTGQRRLVAFASGGSADGCIEIRNTSATCAAAQRAVARTTG
jgi:hypothetical protein